LLDDDDDAVIFWIGSKTFLIIIIELGLLYTYILHGCFAGMVCYGQGEEKKITLVFRQISIINIGSGGSIFREGLSDIFCKRNILNDQR
jgi:hypothetical protein